MRPITIRVKKKKLRAVKMILIGCIIIGLVFAVDHRVRPLIQLMAGYQAQLLVTRNINEAVMDVINEEDVVYNTIVSVSKGSDGQVSSISTDMVTMNRLKAEITNQVSEHLEENLTQTISIPVGTLIGGALLSGRGPELEFKVLPSGYVQTSIYNDFQSAGINQTLHRVMLSVRVTVSAIMPLYTVTKDVETNLSIAETMIVGQVPSSYTDINGDMSTLLDQYNNYHSDEIPEQ